MNKRVIFYLVVAVLVAALLLFNYILGSLPFVEDLRSGLSDLQQKQLDTFLQMNSLLSGLATLAFGGIGALIWERRKAGQVSPRQVSIAAGSCGLSLYFGYLSYKYLIWMLDHQFFNLNNDVVAITNLLQFLAFFVAVIALGDFVFIS